MGYGSYTSSDWDTLRTDRGITSTSTLDDLYTATKMEDYFNPAKIDFRESRDSKDNPVSTPIILGLDVTGSMGYLSTEIAKTHLNKTIMELLNKNIVLGPQILFMAIGDSKCDKAPLQVTQFESDIRIAKQLLDLWFEGAGGDAPESFHLAWWFAMNHTKTDCDEKRNEKGFLFTIGDASCHDTLTSREITKVFGDSTQENWDSKKLYEKVSEKYHTFHINLSEYSSVARDWEDLAPKHVINLPKSNIDYLSDAIVAAIRITQGEKKTTVIKSYGPAASSILAAAMVNI